VDVDPDSATVRVDWHGYAPDQVATWADKVIEAAYGHGFRWVEFVHGAPDVAARGTPGWEGASVAGRGQIKALLRRRFYRGAWRRWIAERREGLHRIEDGRMLIALRDNPHPNRKARWPVMPPPAY
jgi:hypothetical protein